MADGRKNDGPARRGAFGKGLLVGLAVAGSVALALAVRPDPVRAMRGVAVPARTVDPEQVPTPPPPDVDRQPWRATGRDCAWLEAATQAPYAELRDGRWVAIDFCMRPSYERGELLVERGAWVHERADLGPAPPGTLEVQTYGGSVVAGYPDAATGTLESWPKLLEERLEGGEGGRSVRVRNYAISGSTSGPQLWRFEHEGLAEGPDVAILYVGENDLTVGAPLARVTELLWLDFVGTGELGPLGAHPWMAAHRGDLERARERVLGPLDAAGDEIEEARARGRETAPEDPALDDALRAMRATPAVVKALAAGRRPRDLVDLPEARRVLDDLASQRRFEELQAMEEHAAREGVAPGLRPDAEAVAASFLGDLPVEIARTAPLVENVRRFVDLALAHGVVPIVVIPPYDWQDHPVVPPLREALGLTVEDHLAWFTRALPSALRALGRERHVAVVDLPSRVAEPAVRRATFVDNVHLSREGMALVVDLLEPRVRAAATGGHASP